MKSNKLIRGCSSKNMGNKDKTCILADGTKQSLLEAIAEAIGNCPEGVIDLTAGSLAVSQYLSAVCGMRVIANDCRKASFYLGIAIFKSEGVVLTANDIALLQQGDLVGGPVTKLLGTVLGKKNAKQFDRVIGNLGRLAGNGAEIKRHIAIAGMLQAISAELIVYHLRKANRDSGAAGNEHLKDVDLISRWKEWVLSRHPEIIKQIKPGCEIYNDDAVLLMMEKKPFASCLYSDTPYAAGNYPADLKVFEDICYICEGKMPGDPVFRRPVQPRHRFDNRVDFIGSLTKLLMFSAHISRWVISINTSSPVKPEEIVRIVRSLGRKCEIRRYKVSLATNRKRTTPLENYECLIICTPDAELEKQISGIRSRLESETSSRRPLSPSVENKQEANE